MTPDQLAAVRAVERARAEARAALGATEAAAAELYRANEREWLPRLWELVARAGELRQALDGLAAAMEAGDPAVPGGAG